MHLVIFYVMADLKDKGIMGINNILIFWLPRSVLGSFFLFVYVL